MCWRHLHESQRVFSPDSGQCVQSIRACSWITTERPFKAQRRNALLEAAICEMTEDWVITVCTNDEKPSEKATSHPFIHLLIIHTYKSKKKKQQTNKHLSSESFTVLQKNDYNRVLQQAWKYCTTTMYRKINFRHFNYICSVRDPFTVSTISCLK